MQESGNEEGTSSSSTPVDMHVIELLNQELQRIYKIGGHQKFVQVQADSILKKLRGVHTEGQVSRVLYAMSSAFSCKNAPNSKKRKIGNSCIPTQPTSRSRRKPGAPRGAKRIAAGRPSRSEPPNKIRKRPHSLKKTIEANRLHPR